MDLTDIAFELGNVKKNTETIMEHTSKIADKVDDLDNRVSAIESKGRIIKAIWGVLVTVFTLGIKRI